MNEVKLAKEFDYYVAHQSELADKYEGKFISIIGDKVIGAFKTEDEAIAETSKKYELGTFLVHLVGRGEKNYTQVLYHFEMEEAEREKFNN